MEQQQMLMSVQQTNVLKALDIQMERQIKQDENQKQFAQLSYHTVIAAANSCTETYTF